MTRTLGPAGYGVLGYYESLVAVVNVWAAFGVNYYGLRLLSKSAVGDTDHSNTIVHLLLINLGMATIGLVCYLLYVFSRPIQIGTVPISLLYGFIILVFMFHADWYFQSQERYAFLVKRTFYLRLFMLVSSILLVKDASHLFRYIVISTINYGFIAGSAIWSMRGIFSHWKWDPKLFKRLMTALWPFALLGILGALYFSLDTIILARYGKVVALGHYSVAAKIVRLGLNVFVAASIVFFVKLFRSKVDRDLQADSMMMTLHLSIPIAALLFFFAGPVIRFVSGDLYLPAIGLLQWFSLLWIIVPLHDFFNIQVLMVHHRERSLVFLYGTACVISLVLNLVLIPLWFTEGAVLAILLTELFVLIAGIWLSKPYFQIRFPMILQFLTCLSCFPMAWAGAVIAEKFSTKPIPQLLTGSTVTLLGYGLLQWFVFGNSFWKKLWRSANHPA